MKKLFFALAILGLAATGVAVGSVALAPSAHACSGES